MGKLLIRSTKAGLWTASLLLAAATAFAETQECRITSVHDGDSMRVHCPGHKKTTAIRLHQIDAPELDQRHGTKARDYLRSLCEIGQNATIVRLGTDRYGRTLGDVYCQGTDASAAMVASGSAWVYDEYVRDRELYQLQREAKARRKGLWQQRGAVAPWEYRRSR